MEPQCLVTGLEDICRRNRSALTCPSLVSRRERGGEPTLQRSLVYLGSRRHRLALLAVSRPFSRHVPVGLDCPLSDLGACVVTGKPQCDDCEVHLQG